MAITTQLTPELRSLIEGAVQTSMIDAQDGPGVAGTTDGVLNLTEISGTVRSTHALLETVVPTNSGAIGAVSHCDFLFHANRWHPSTLASLGCMVLTPMGSPSYNGGLLADRYDAIQDLEPHGNALAADNRAILVLAGGDWDIGSIGLTLQNHTVIAGLLGARIVTGSQGLFHIARNTSLVDLRLVSSADLPVMQMIGASTGFTHRNLVIEGSGHDAILIPNDPTSFSSAVIENVRTDCDRLYGCPDDTIGTPPSLDSTSVIRGCKGGIQSFFGNNYGPQYGMESFAGQIAGLLVDCEMTGSVCDIRITSTGRMRNCTWAAPVRAVETGAQFSRCDIALGSDEPSISNDFEGSTPGTVAATISVAQCILSGVDNTGGGGATHKGLGEDITNDLGADHSCAFTPLP